MEKLDATLSRRLSFGMLAAASGLLMGCTPPAPTPFPRIAVPDNPMSPVEVQKFARNSSIFNYKKIASSSPSKNVISYYWSPTCQDSMRGYRDLVRPLMTDTANQNDSFTFIVYPRHENDIKMALAMLEPDPSQYPLIALAHLALGAKRDKFLLMKDTQDIVRKFGRSPDSSRSYDAKTADGLLRATNKIVLEQVKIDTTPLLVVNGQIISYSQGTSIAQVKSVMRG